MKALPTKCNKVQHSGQGTREVKISLRAKKRTKESVQPKWISRNKVQGWYGNIPQWRTQNVPWSISLQNTSYIRKGKIFCGSIFWWFARLFSQRAFLTWAFLWNCLVWLPTTRPLLTNEMLLPVQTCCIAYNARLWRFFESLKSSSLSYPLDIQKIPGDFAHSMCFDELHTTAV